jgi:hypothetical protein
MAEPTASMNDTCGCPSTRHVSLETFVTRSVTIPIPAAALAPMPPTVSCDEAHTGTVTRWGERSRGGAAAVSGASPLARGAPIAAPPVASLLRVQLLRAFI